MHGVFPDLSAAKAAAGDEISLDDFFALTLAPGQ
jgi:hypothetical protein